MSQSLTAYSGINQYAPWLELRIDQTQIPQYYCSTFQYTLILHRPSNISSSQAKSWGLNVGGHVVSGSAVVGGSGDLILSTGSTPAIVHDPTNGSIVTYVECYITLDITWSGQALGTLSNSGWFGWAGYGPATYTITYDANGGTGAPGNQTKTHGVNINLSTQIPSRTGHTFQGWSKSPTGPVNYLAGQLFGEDANTTLYAIWTVNTYTVSYNANGGTGAPGNQTKTWGSILTLSSVSPTRPGYTFKGWSKDPNGPVQYLPGQQFGEDANTVLYAIWESATLISFNVTTQSATIDRQITSLVNDASANFPSLSLSYTPVTDSTNGNINFYYRICYTDDNKGTVSSSITNSENKTYGPFSKASIDAGSTAIGSKSIPVSESIFKNALMNTGSEKEILLCLFICTGDNSFSSSRTYKQLIRIPLNNFNFSSIEFVKCYRNSSNGVNIEVNITFPKSYSNIVGITNPFYTYVDNDSTPIVNPTLNSKTVIGNTVKYVATLSGSQVDSDSHTLKLMVPDGMTSPSIYVRVGAVRGEDIYIYKSNNMCEAVEFIEDSNTSQFVIGGRVYSGEIIEDSNGVIIANSEAHFGELKEK